MKTIIIPKKFGYPTLEVTINGKVYTVKSGEEITTEDIIAETIEHAIALEPKQGINKSKIAQIAEGSITKLTADDLFGIESIVYYAFGQCYSLEVVELPDSVKKIGISAFVGCKELKEVSFGENSKINVIESNAFDWCVELSKVCLPKIPPTLVNVNAFQNIKTTCTFYCKSQESLNAYKAAANWSTLTGTYTFKVEEKE